MTLLRAKGAADGSDRFVGFLLRRLDEDLDRPDPLLVYVDMMAGRHETRRYRHLPPYVGAVSYPESLRDRISQHEVYPINRTALDSALSDAGVATLDTIYFLRAGVREFRDSGVGDVMEISFRAATADVPQRLEIRIHAVPAVSKQVIGVAVTNLLDDAAAWVRRAEISENVWRSTDHGLALRWDGDNLRLIER